MSTERAFGYEHVRHFMTRSDWRAVCHLVDREIKANNGVPPAHRKWGCDALESLGRAILPSDIDALEAGLIVATRRFYVQRTRAGTYRKWLDRSDRARGGRVKIRP